MEKTKKIPSKPVGKCNKKTIIIISAVTVAVLGALLAIVLLSNSDSATKVGYVETNKKGLWEASYALLDGTLEKEFSSDGEKTLLIEFSTESGEMDLMVYDKATGNAFVGDMPTYFECVGNGFYEITYSENVVVRLTAREHKGSFSVRIK